MRFHEIKSQLDEKCWTGYHRVKGTKAGSPGSCAKNEGVAEGIESLSSWVKQDQDERNQYRNFVMSQAGGDWDKGRKMYAKLKKRPSNDVFGEKERSNQFMKTKFDFEKFTKDDWNNYWLLAQHCDNNRSFQKQALAIIAKYEGTNNDHYRYLYDRISCGTTGQQKYGTQDICEEDKQGVDEGKNKLFVKKLKSETELKEHAIKFAKNISKDGVPVSTKNRHYVVCSTIFAACKKSINESKHITGGKEFISLLKRLDQFDKLDIDIGKKVAIINTQLQGDSVELWGFTTPKTITKIFRDPTDKSIKQFEFNNDPDDVWPRTESAEYQGHYLMYSAFFGDKKSAEHAVTLLSLQGSEDLSIRNHITEQQETLHELPATEGLNKQQQKVGQLGPLTKAKKISPVLGKPEKPHPFQGKLVGASE